MVTVDEEQDDWSDLLDDAVAEEQEREGAAATSSRSPR